MYTIEVCYTTGDSFNTESHIEEKIGCCWKSKELAKKGLQAIKEHYNIFSSRGFRDNRSPEEKNKEAVKFDWYNDAKHDGFIYPEFSLLLDIDDGTKQITNVFWIGYFETLHGARIVADEDDEDSFTID